MKLTTLLLIVTMLQVSAGSYAQRITLSQKNVVLVEVFDQIRIQTGYDFIFNNSILKGAKKVTISVKDAELEEVLKQIFADQPLKYKINDNKSVVVTKKDKSVLDKVIDFFSAIDVRGKVVDEQGLPLPGASVKVKGSALGTVTDKDGEFFLKGVPEDAIVVIAYLGYKPLEVKASASLGVIKLEQLSSELTEVVINKGYYSESKKLSTGSVAKISAAEIERQPVTNLLAAMQGRTPGIYIEQASGVPGGNFQVRIRGTNSLSSGNDPLYIVDGVPFISESMANPSVSSALYKSGMSPLNSINPTDIESIEILRDADATAIYGSRGANGVVLVTTKSGKAGALKVDVSHRSGISKMTRHVDMMKTEEYLAMRRESLTNDGVPVGSGDYDLNGSWSQNRYTDWQKELISGNAQMHDLNGSLSGGGDQTQFLFGAGFNSQTTVFPGTNSADRFSTHFSVTHTSSNKKFSTRLSTNYTLNNSNIVYVDLTGTALSLAPNAPLLYGADGSTNWENSTFLSNPIAELGRRYKSNTYNLLTNMELRYELIKNLRFKTSVGLSDIRNNDRGLFPSDANTQAPILQPSPSKSQRWTGIITNQSWIIEPQLNWENQLGKGMFSALIGGTYQNRVIETQREIFTGFASNALIDNPMAASRNQLEVYDYSQYKYAALYGRANYTWDEKYILNITGRRDGSSRFGPGKKFANFGALGIGWIFSKEEFIQKKLSFLSFGKLRGSYGLTGNDQIGDYRYLDAFSAGSSYNGMSGLRPVRLFNPDYGWEVNKKAEVAIDLGFLKDRILLNAAYYSNRSSNQLINYTLASTSGFASILQNFPATVQNTGLELALNIINVNRTSLRWSTSFNITFPQNKLVAFPNLESSSYANTFVLGKSLSIYRAFHYLDVDPNTGLHRFSDMNGDGQITDEDKQSLIEFKKNWFGGIQNSLRLFGLQVDVLFQLVSQTGMAFGQYSTPGDFLDTRGNQPAGAFEGRWRTIGDTADQQLFSTATDAKLHYGRYRSSDAFEQTVFFLRLKNVSLSYDLPKIIYKTVKARIFAQAQNLFTLTNYIGLDPETGSGVLPPLTTGVFGLQITL